MDALGALITFVVGVGGATLGAVLARRNDRRAQAERLLVEALNDAVQAIASVAGGAGAEAQRAYASAVSRVALHGSPTVIAAFRRFQDDATTTTVDGRRRLLAAVRSARDELGHRVASEADLSVLLFGSGPVVVERWPRVEEQVRESVDALRASATERDREYLGEQDAQLERIADLADVEPEAAVVEAFRLVEQDLHRIADAGGVSRAPSMPPAALADVLERAGLINRETLSAVRGLVALRNLAAQDRGHDVSAARARDYVALVQGVLFALSRAARPADGRLAT
jgi:hypothetical protein